MQVSHYCPVKRARRGVDDSVAAVALMTKSEVDIHDDLLPRQLPGLKSICRQVLAIRKAVANACWSLEGAALFQSTFVPVSDTEIEDSE